MYIWGWWAIARFDTQLDTYSSIRTIDKHKVASSGYFCILQLVLSLPSIYQHRISWLGGHSPNQSHDMLPYRIPTHAVNQGQEEEKPHTPRSICRRTPHNPAYRTFYHSFFVNVSDALVLFAKCFVLWSRPAKALSSVSSPLRARNPAFYLDRSRVLVRSTEYCTGILFFFYSFLWVLTCSSRKGTSTTTCWRVVQHSSTPYEKSDNRL
ncbi:hypothetical protein X797_000010 [Metarhizium robertsii]|uniref:Uncharacterized protein n=1 Tax=Metarhizium robertsii TaxID=568076 RepID=A0A0A1V534_9HYPO|nr:hypothetical protein X797_000010 [Metarhizium robertsii]